MNKSFHISRRSFLRRTTLAAAATGLPLWFVERRLAAVTAQIGGQAALDAALEKTGMTPAQLRTSLAQGVLREAVQNARFAHVVGGARCALFLPPQSRQALRQG